MNAELTLFTQDHQCSSLYHRFNLAILGIISIALVLSLPSDIGNVLEGTGEETRMLFSMCED